MFSSYTFALSFCFFYIKIFSSPHFLTSKYCFFLVTNFHVSEVSLTQLLKPPYVLSLSLVNLIIFYSKIYASDRHSWRHIFIPSISFACKCSLVKLRWQRHERCGMTWNKNIPEKCPTLPVLILLPSAHNYYSWLLFASRWRY